MIFMYILIIGEFVLYGSLVHGVFVSSTYIPGPCLIPFQTFLGGWAACGNSFVTHHGWEGEN